MADAQHDPEAQQDGPTPAELLELLDLLGATADRGQALAPGAHVPRPVSHPPEPPSEEQEPPPTSTVSADA